jgi:acyl-CoA thioesterase FadM
MAAPSRIERPYRVRFDEAGPDGHLRSGGFLRYAQDLAWIHSESAGFGREWYGERGLTWLVRAIELDVLTDVAYGSELVVSTELIGLRRVWVRRRSEFHSPGTERPAALAITDWVLLSARGVPTRVPAEIADAFPQPLANFTPLRLDALEPPPNASEQRSKVRRSELDPMAHVNNAAYLDYLDEHFLADRRARASMPTPRRYRAEFIASAEPDTDLVGRGWNADGSWCFRLADGSGTEMLRARLETDAASWVGG